MPIKLFFPIPASGVISGMAELADTERNKEEKNAENREFKNNPTELNDDLQKLMNRRREWKNLLSIPIDDKITDRYYPKEAIRAVCEQLGQGFRKHPSFPVSGTKAINDFTPIRIG